MRRHLLSRREAASYVCSHGVALSEATLATWASRGNHIDDLPPQKIAGRVYYRVADLDRFLGLDPDAQSAR